MFLTIDTKRILEQSLGLSIRELAALSVDEENSFIEKKLGRKPAFSKVIDRRISARGNHLLAQKRIITMEDIDAKVMGWKFDE